MPGHMDLTAKHGLLIKCCQPLTGLRRDQSRQDGETPFIEIVPDTLPFVENLF